MDAINDRLAKAYPEANKGWSVLVEPLPPPVGQYFEQSLYLLFGAAGVVLLIGCVNVANLALARNVARAREVAIRVALGAGQGRLVQQLLTEHVVIAIGGGLSGLVLGDAMLAALKTAIPSSGLVASVPPDTTMAMDASVCLFALAVSVLSGIAFGLAPAVGATRLEALAFSIKESGGTGASAGRAQQRLRQTLVVAEVALAFVLLTGASLLVQSFFALRQRVEAGFDSTNVLTAGLPIPDTRFKDPAALTVYLNQLAGRIKSLPSIRDVAFTDGLPTQGEPFGTAFQIAGQPAVDRSQRPIAGFKTVTSSYFHAVGLRILTGRALDDRDRADAPFALVINETMARTHFRGLDPIGHRLIMDASGLRAAGNLLPDVTWEVVGVMTDEGVWPFGDRGPHATVYVPIEQNPTCCLTLVVRATLDPARLQESIRKAVSAFDRDQALTNIQLLDQLKTEPLASDRLRSVLLGAFAAIALSLAAIGLYGVIAYSVVQRTREIGIRAALGASTGNLVALIVRQGMALTAWGLAVGLAGALVVSRLLATLLFGVGPSDPTTMVAVAGTLAGVALLACYLPARRATRVNPLIALRSD